MKGISVSTSLLIACFLISSTITAQTSYYVRDKTNTHFIRVYSASTTNSVANKTNGSFIKITISGLECDLVSADQLGESGDDQYAVCKDGSVYVQDPQDTVTSWRYKGKLNKPIKSISMQKKENGARTIGSIVGDNGVIYSTSDGGNNWYEVSSGTTNNLNKIYYGWCATTKKSYGYAVGDNSTVIVTKDSGKTWTKKTTPYQYDHFYGLHFFNNEVGYIVGSSGIAYKTIDSGESWSYLEVDHSNPNFYGVYFLSHLEGWICGANGYLGHTTNGGSTWVKEDSGTTPTLNDLWAYKDSGETKVRKNVKESRGSSQNIRGSITYAYAVGNNGTLLKYSSTTGTWEKIDLGTTENLNDVSVDSEGYVWIFGNNGSIYTNLPAAPSSPSGLTAVVKSSSRIDLSWTDNSNDETGFRIEEKIGATGTWVSKDSVAANVVVYQATGLHSNTQYSYRIRAFNAGGTSSISNIVSATTLDIAPTAPTSLSATVISSSQINLSWTDNSTNETGFKIERKNGSSGVWISIDSVGANVTAFLNTGLTPNTQYYYRVSSYNVAGVSSTTNEVSATTLGVSPTAPTSLSATVVSSSQINLSWTDNSSNETGFKIERKIGDSGTWTSIDSTAANVITFQNTGLTPNTKYYYRVSAYNSIGVSSCSNEISVTTSDVAPTTPTNLSATVVSSSQINLSWTDNSNNENGFKIERKNGQSAFAEIASVGQNITSYSNSSLSDGTSYTYRVVAYNSIGNSIYSNEASAITKLDPPTDLTIKLTTSYYPQLDWKDHSQNETGFRIEKKLGTGSYSKLTDVAANIITYTDSQVLVGNQYFYKVLAFNSIISSDYSNEISILVVDVRDEDALPTEFFLNQNYPNPFNPTTNIKFSIPKSGWYSLSVYNTLGQTVGTLADQEFFPGNFVVTFNAASLASGSYFYHLYGEGVSIIKKMVLIK